MRIRETRMARDPDAELKTESSGTGNILVFNAGSSSLSYKIYETSDDGRARVILKGKASRVGVTGTEQANIRTEWNGEATDQVGPISNHRKAAALALQFIVDHKIQVDYIGHRFVHGGTYFRTSTFVDTRTLETLKLCRPLAPIHNPNSLSVIGECQRLMPRTEQYVVFDSAFHSSISEVASRYALPVKLAEKYGFRKYGFHGLSYSYVVKAAGEYLKSNLEGTKIVACHLGTGGSSVAAIKNGHSIDTSMGYTPLPGLVMSTRCGDVDPMLAVYLMAVYKFRPEDLVDLFSTKSGLLGISGFSSDIRDIVNRTSGEEKEQAELAFDMYVHRIRKYIGSYIVELRGIDVLLFTDDIGLRSWQVREAVCQHMHWCGLKLDADLNRTVVADRVCVLNTSDSRVKVLTVPTDEELVICREGIRLLKEAV